MCGTGNQKIKALTTKSSLQWFYWIILFAYPNPLSIFVHPVQFPGEAEPKPHCWAPLTTDYQLHVANVVHQEIGRREVSEAVAFITIAMGFPWASFVESRESCVSSA